MKTSLAVNVTVLGHFGLDISATDISAWTFRPGHFGLDISATDIWATENAKGGRFGHNHEFWVWDVCMHECVILKSNMHVNTFSIFKDA